MSPTAKIRGTSVSNLSVSTGIWRFSNPSPHSAIGPRLGDSP